MGAAATPPLDDRAAAPGWRGRGDRAARSARAPGSRSAQGRCSHWHQPRTLAGTAVSHQCSRWRRRRRRTGSPRRRRQWTSCTRRWRSCAGGGGRGRVGSGYGACARVPAALSAAGTWPGLAAASHHGQGPGDASTLPMRSHQHSCEGHRDTPRPQMPPEAVTGRLWAPLWVEAPRRARAALAVLNRRAGISAARRRRARLEGAIATTMVGVA